MSILKFGGSNFLDPEGYHRVARHIAQRRAAGENKIVVVVSAMKGETDSLKAQMLEVNKEASPSNLDAAMATGEMISACRLEAAVSRLGISVTSLNGYGLGIGTNSDFGRATVESVDPRPIRSALQEHDVVIAAGAQAINQSGRLTFLGRNASDLTAVVIASMLEEHACEIYSDVPGVYTGDPNLIAEAQLIPEIAYEAIAAMSRYGAKVLHHGAVEYAEKHGVTIFCKSLTNDGVVTGTTVIGHGNARSVTVARDAVVISFASVAERDNRRALLDQNGITAIDVEQNEGPGLCVMSDTDFAKQLVAGPCTPPVSVQSTMVVTVLDASIRRIHLIGDYERAVSLARQLHEQMYPGAVAERFGRG
ncbi:uridylate kinase [Sinorhizobium meliloti]|uniref:aspartate kinase n=1 Tax=Sinorhizobium meliloti (strain SM11) TaxID=707241 RepID=F7XFJ4_SINMM|nr:uridylate kinase [Sinorhizobium meliloti]AEH82314.1 aspartokinase [Sinorhizobium meliloti SM11]ARS66849.1 uridylate kinase [Sinorhizobium meliloti RU11/001]MDE3793640.1 uridylate kinase [Sinorhizobium meliloti]MDE4562372.1 uridylate kinase [Sinorhizobium meliloti SM11]RVG51972.1 uridylate kinase [Sinorhizobium meliloti]